MKPALRSALTCTCCVLIVCTTGMAADDRSPVPVRTAKVTASSMVHGKAFVGTIEPTRRSVVGTAVAGRMESVFTEEGDLVEDAGKLAQLRLKHAQIRLAAAKADLEVSLQELAELVAGPRAEELQRLAARVKGAEAVLAFATKNFQRLVSMSERGATARGELDEALSAMQAAEQTQIAAQAEHTAAVKGTRQEQLAQARAKVAKATEEVNRIQDELDEHTIRAPFRGYVVKRTAEQGEWLKVGSPIAEIVELDPAEIRLAVPEEYISRIRQGQQVRVDVAALATPGSPLKPLTGTVFRIVPDADSRSRSFPVRIRIENPIEAGSPLLKPGMSAKVFLPIGQADDELLVPQDALVLDRNRAYLFVVDVAGDKTLVRRVEVKPGAARDAMIRFKPVEGAVGPGSEVVVEGNERLESGQSVEMLGG